MGSGNLTPTGNIKMIERDYTDETLVLLNHLKSLMNRGGARKSLTYPTLVRLGSVPDPRQRHNLAEYVVKPITDSFSKVSKNIRFPKSFSKDSIIKPVHQLNYRLSINILLVFNFKMLFNNFALKNLLFHISYPIIFWLICVDRLFLI